jgi:selenide,water dikinase
LAGGQAGDMLILTKPIGSGVILAAEMQGKAAG